MPIIVKDILSLQTTKNFTLIAGQSGLGRIIETVDILDYAWEQDRQFSRKLFKPKRFSAFKSAIRKRTIRNTCLQ